jgi:hypothetical protein
MSHGSDLEIVAHGLNEAATVWEATQLTNPADAALPVKRGSAFVHPCLSCGTSVFLRHFSN